MFLWGFLMSNMGYCRFENTYNDLVDCFEHIHDELDDSENHYRDKLMELCGDILDKNG